MAAVLRQQLDWTPLPQGTPAAIHRLLRRCLVRDARMRLPDIGVARLDIDEALAQPLAASDVAHGKRARRLAVPMLAACLAGLVLGGGATLGWLRSTPISESEPRILQITSGARIAFPSISPKGRHVVFVRDGRLVVRALDSVVDRTIDGTDGASAPAWSPDSTSIAYFGTGEAGPELRVVPAAGGASRMGDAWRLAGPEQTQSSVSSVRRVLVHGRPHVRAMGRRIVACHRGRPGVSGLSAGSSVRRLELRFPILPA